ncbi:MAG: HAMP domain-containing protein, partial [Chromatiales bacterium]|nr:HAMP domain-containing protein [Chromatiales bacterium]
QRAMGSTLITLLISVLGVGVLIYFIARFISIRMTRPINALIDGADAVMQHNYTYSVPGVGCGEFRALIEVFNKMIQWVGEMTNLKESLSKLLSDELADKAAREGLVLGGQSVECTIMFTDFAAFSTLSQKMDAEQVVHLLNRYFGELVPIVKHWNGFPDKYIGDAIVAMFGAPVHFENHAEQAVRAAIEMQRRLRVLNEEIRQEHGVVFEMRIGINSGTVVVGAIGCDMKLEYTSIGDTTNLANRMESQCPVGHLMITERTYELIKDCDLGNVVIRRREDGVVVKGYRDPLTTYEIYVDDLSVTLSSDISSDVLRFYQYERISH